MIEIEKHPLEPFLPAKAKLLMLGSFPPQKKRWSMDFYYPNLNNGYARDDEGIRYSLIARFSKTNSE